jgi:solute carrier family 38 (sodium-coupled neutral amino acid transporter), member 11
VAASTAAGSDDAGAAEQGGTSSMTASTFNLAKNIIGGGMLALPAGMAAGSGTGFVPAIALMTGTCLLSAYTFVLVGKSVAHTRAKSFKDLWAKTIGKDRLLM